MDDRGTSDLGGMAVSDPTPMCPFGQSESADVRQTLEGTRSMTGGGHTTPCIEGNCALWVPYSDGGACAFYMQGQAALLSLEVLVKAANPTQPVKPEPPTEGVPNG